MKFLLIAFALVGVVAAAILPDSATQGPNPQDIATPEPEYIDIDENELPLAPAPAPAPKSANLFSTAARPIQSVYSVPISNHLQNDFIQQVPGHYHGQSGYQYRRPVYIRRVYRRRY